MTESLTTHENTNLGTEPAISPGFDCESAPPANRQWFVLYTKARQERVARDNLERQEFEVYLPEIEITKRRKTGLVAIVEPFFPRYLFIRFDCKNDDWGPIRSTRGVCGLVRFEGVPKPLPSNLIDMLRLNENTQKLQIVNKKTWETGDTVQIEQGSFAGYKCIFQTEKSAERVCVLLTIVGKQTRTTLLKQDLQIPQFA